MKKISIVYDSREILIKDLLFIIWIPLIIIAKIIRYTMLKETLVDNGIGYIFLDLMQRGNLHFDLFENLKNTTDTTGNAALIFSFLNILKLNTYVQYEIAISIIGNTIMILLFKKISNDLSILQFCYLVILILSVNIFDLCLSKEPIQIVLFGILAYIIRKTNDREIICILKLIIFIVIMSVIFRTYCLFMIPFAGCAFLTYKLYIKNKNLFLAIIFMLVSAGGLYILCLLLAKQVSISVYTELIRVRIRMVPSKTRIAPFIQTADNLFLYMVNYLTVVIRLLFPIELLHFGIRYAVYFVCQLIITTVFFKTFICALNSDTKCKFSLIIFTSFLFMSAIHEIEFGSWIRHEVAIFPILIMFCEHENNKRLAAGA